MPPLDRNTGVRQILEAVNQLFEMGVMSHSGHANLSARLSENTYLITTTGMVRNLAENDFAVVDLDGNILQGSLEPTNLEIVDMHSIIYRLRSEVGAIIHTHSPGVLAFALANKALPCRYEALLRFGQAADVPVAQWGPRGSQQSIAAIRETVEENPDSSSLILANHGLLAFGADPVATARLISAIEEAAEAELSSSGLGGAVDFPTGALEAVRESMARALR